MQTHFSETALAKPHIQKADKVLRSCVHCGFCNATCPTYQLLGDERDGPRGRIYLIKQLLESDPESPDEAVREQATQITRETQQHLDRCLSCRSCETTCPSGVQYHTLLDIGRSELERRVGRPWRERLIRTGLRHALVEPARFKTLLALGVRFRPLAPPSLADKIPSAGPSSAYEKLLIAQSTDQSLASRRPPAAGHMMSSHSTLSSSTLSSSTPEQSTRQVLMLEGCVQPGLAPNINAATERVLARFGMKVIPIHEAGCCGAIDYHLNAQQAGRMRMRANIDAWWPAIEAGADCIVQTASGCGAFVKEYAEMLADDPDYAERAARVSALARDIVEVLGEAIERCAALEDMLATTVPDTRPLAFHCPCTLQHAQGLGGAVENLMRQLGFTLTPVMEGHLCCGSAGTYSITQPELSRQLRDRKLEVLEASGAEQIITANIGCQTHLNGAGRMSARHWIELVDDALPPMERHA